jgi:phosphohistidine phosphatase
VDLIFWRHAEAILAAADTLDLDRPLTARGEKNAKRMAAWMNKQLPEATKIWVSPALRTVQTALTLGRKYRIRSELAPDSNPEALLGAIQWPAAKMTTLVVGHQPIIGQTIADLLGLSEQEIAIKKGAVWWLRYREREGVGQTVVVTVQTPELL